jgi:hypothetical protein
MARYEIVDLDLTDRAIEKASWHGIGEDQIYALLDHFWTITRNRAGRVASHVLLGTDNQGRCIAIPVNATEDPRIWQPVTAWYCKPGEATILRKARGR